jgi:AcrR family transcriptional regulator
VTDDFSVRPGASGPPDLDHDEPTSAVSKSSKGKGARTRGKLVQAAEEVFNIYGYYDASIVKITEAAGVAQGTFYVYFRSKKEIFDEVVADLNRRVRHAMSEASRGATSRLEAERLGFAGFFRFTSEHPALYRVIRQAEFVSPGALRNHYEKVAEGYVAPLRQAMDAGDVTPGDPMILAWLLMAIGESVGLRWIIWDEAKAVPPEVFDEMMVIIARMLGGQTSGTYSDGTAIDSSSHDDLGPDTGDVTAINAD